MGEINVNCKDALVTCFGKLHVDIKQRKAEANTINGMESYRKQLFSI